MFFLKKVTYFIQVVTGPQLKKTKAEKLNNIFLNISALV